MTADEQQKFNDLQSQVDELRARVAALDAHSKESALKDCESEKARVWEPYPLQTPAKPPFYLVSLLWPPLHEYAKPLVPTWRPYKGPTCAGRAITCTGITVHEAT